VNGTPATTKIVSVEKAESADGKPTGYGSDKAVDFVRVDGEKVYLSDKLSETDSVKKSNSDIAGLAEATFYYDTFGNIIYVDNVTEAVRELDGYVYLVSATATAPSTGVFTAKDPTVKYDIVDLATGTTATVDAAFGKNTDGNWVYADKNGKLPAGSTTVDGTAKAWNAAEGAVAEATAGFYGYYKQEDGTYVLTARTSLGYTNEGTYNSQVIVQKNVATVLGAANVYADANTKLTYVTFADNKYTVKTVTGIANFPTLTAASNATGTNVTVIANTTDTKKIDEILVYGATPSGETAEATTKTYGMFKQIGEYDNASQTREYIFVVNGEEVTYKGADSKGFSANEVYEIKLDADGLLTSTTAANTTTKYVTNCVVQTVGDTYVVTNDGTHPVVYTATGCQTADVSTAKTGVAKDAYVNIYTNSDYKAVYIVAVNNG
jgi:hypothetical protein